MEVKINKEIRNYTEHMFFGLSLRQFIFSILACGVAVGIYFGFRNRLGTETVSWLCMLGAAPFAALGFVRYHGMTAEQFIGAWVKSEILYPKYLTFKPTNLYYEVVKDQIEQNEREACGKGKSRSKRKKDGVLSTLNKEADCDENPS